ncbi:MAG: hypothetical protein AAFN77_14775 [Planctomycetota bacterium]
MKPSRWILALLFLSVVVLPIGGCFVLIGLLAPPDVTVHADVIPRDRAHYSAVVTTEFPADNAYCYDLNTYISIPNIDTTNVNVANELGQVPAFQFEGSIFIVLHKGRNYSRGLVLTKNAADLADKHRTIEFRKLEPGLYYWEQDGQRSVYEPDLYERELVLPIGE